MLREHNEPTNSTVNLYLLYFLVIVCFQSSLLFFFFNFSNAKLYFYLAPDPNLKCTVTVAVTVTLKDHPIHNVPRWLQNGPAEDGPRDNSGNLGEDRQVADGPPLPPPPCNSQGKSSGDQLKFEDRKDGTKCSATATTPNEMIEIRNNRLFNI
jgi:hypothetical protein